MNLVIERVTEPTPEAHELINELDHVLNAAYEPTCATACRLLNCLSRKYAFS